MSPEHVFHPQRNQEQFRLPHHLRCPGLKRHRSNSIHPGRNHGLPLLRQRHRRQHRSPIRPLDLCNDRPRRHRRPRYVLLPFASPPLPRKCRRSPQMAPKNKQKQILLKPKLHLHRLQPTPRHSPPLLRQEAQHRDRRDALRRHHDGRHHPELPSRDDRLEPRSRPRLRRQHRQHEHQLHPARPVLLQDREPRLATAPAVA